MPSSYTIGARFESLIEDLVKAGRYNNADEVILDGLRMVEAREKKLEVLDTAIARGLADADADRVHTIEDVRAHCANGSIRNKRGNDCRPDDGCPL